VYGYLSVVIVAKACLPWGEIMVKHWLVFAFLLLLSACVSKEAALEGELDKEMELATRTLNQLKAELGTPSRLSNVTILRKYADDLGRMKPSLATAAQTMASNGDPEGPMVQALEKRLNAVRLTKGRHIDRLKEQLVEVVTVKEAANPNVFNDALADSVNVIADLSDGKLSRVQSISRRDQASRYEAAYAAPGAQLIGNPQYGYWEQEAGGGYIWTWFAVYWFFDEVLDLDDVFERRHYRYGYWSRHRPYSYYYDHGRYRYTSPKTLKKQYTQDQKFAATTRNKPRSQRHRSPFAKKAPGGGTVSLASRKTSTNRSARSSSPYAFTSSSSSRQGASRTNRGPRWGK
jgi:hypothetical protein